jgi:hypothetical protein
MSEHDNITEVAAPPVIVEETNRLFRLRPSGDDLLKASRMVALVPADTEEEARRLATLADPMGCDGADEKRFVAESMETQERHVIGDLIFRSTPNAASNSNRRRGK